MIKTSGVHHISLTVKDVKKSTDFYTKICGMKIIVAENEYAGDVPTAAPLYVPPKPSGGE